MDYSLGLYGMVRLKSSSFYSSITSLGMSYIEKEHYWFGVDSIA